jgi:hypothetical protein
MRNGHHCDLGLSAQMSILTITSWVFRENNVPHYQREFQKHDGLRTWEKVRSLYMEELGMVEEHDVVAIPRGREQPA